MATKHRTTFVCFLVFLFIYGLTSSADLHISDEIAVFSSGISLATNVTLNIDSLEWLQARENLGHPGPDGHLYAKYFPGNILGTTLLYKIARQPNDEPYVWNDILTSQSYILADSNIGARTALRLNAFLGSIGIAALCAFLLRRFDHKTAISTVLIFGLSTHWWFQARGLFSETGAGAFLILSLYFADAELPSLSGIALGLSLLFRPTNLLGIPIWIYGVWKKGIRSAWTGLFIVLGFAILVIYNWLRFNSFLDFGYVNEHFNTWIVEGIVGVLFSPGRSLFFYSPILILCISGAQMLYRRDKLLTGTLLIVIIGYILSSSLWHDWDGGTSWGSRLITPILPLMGILLAPMVEKMFSPQPEKTRFYIGLFTCLGLGIQLITVAANPGLALIHYVWSGQIPYADTINSFENSWLSIQIRYLQYWKICNIDAYSLRYLFAQCR